jgi:hypothetical protein
MLGQHIALPRLVTVSLPTRQILLEFRNAARNQERVRVVIKRWRSTGVLCVAVRHEHDQTLPRPREQDTIRVQKVQLVRLVANLLPFGALEGVVLPSVVGPTQITIPADVRSFCVFLWRNTWAKSNQT